MKALGGAPHPVIFAVGRVTVRGERLTRFVRLGPQAHQPLPELGEILRLGAATQRLPRGERNVVAIQPRAPEVGALVEVRLHIDIHFDVCTGNADLATTQQRNTFAPGGGEGGGGAEGGVDKRLHRLNPPLAVGVRTVAREEEGDVIASLKLRLAQMPEATRRALFDAARAVRERLGKCSIDGITRGIGHKSLGSILTNRRPAPRVEAHLL